MHSEKFAGLQIRILIMLKWKNSVCRRTSSSLVFTWEFGRLPNVRWSKQKVRCRSLSGMGRNERGRLGNRWSCVESGREILNNRLHPRVQQPITPRSRRACSSSIRAKRKRPLRHYAFTKRNCIPQSAGLSRRWFLHEDRSFSYCRARASVGE